MVSATRSACPFWKTSGGRILRTLPWRPVLPIRMPAWRISSMICLADGSVDDLDADGHAYLSDLTNTRALDRPQLCAQVVADRPSVVDDPFVVHDLQHGQRRGHGDRVAAERAEELTAEARMISPARSAL